MIDLDEYTAREATARAAFVESNIKFFVGEKIYNEIVSAEDPLNAMMEFGLTLDDLKELVNKYGKRWDDYCQAKHESVKHYD